MPKAPAQFKLTIKNQIKSGIYCTIVLYLFISQRGSAPRTFPNTYQQLAFLWNQVGN